MILAGAMTGPARFFLLFSLLASLLAGTAAIAHRHDDAQDPDSGMVPCAFCVHASHGDEALPPAPGPSAALPVGEPVARAFALRTAVRPVRTVIPPGRAPPAAR